MKKRQWGWEDVLVWVVVGLATLWLGWSLAGMAVNAQEPPPKAEYGPQVVMTVSRTEGGKKYVVPRGTVWFKLDPIGGPTANAPMPRGDVMLCRAFLLRDENGGNHIGYRCGDDTYGVESVGVEPPK